MKELVYIVDDEQGIGRLCQDFLSDRYETVVFESPEEALSAFETRHPDLMITDMKMPKISGFELIEIAQSLGWRKPVIMMSGFAQKADVLRAINGQVAAFVEKPFDPSELNSVIERVSYKAEASESHEQQINRLANKVEVLSRIAVLQKAKIEHLEAKLELSATALKVVERDLAEAARDWTKLSG